MSKIKKLKPVFIMRGIGATTFSTMMSSLALYLNADLGFSELQAVSLVGLFLGFHYIMPLIGGYLANHFVNGKFLYIAGMIFQFFGYSLLAFSHLVAWPLALILMGSMVATVTTIMVVNQVCEGDDAARRKATQINYVSCNTGLLFGFIASGLVSQIFSVHAVFKVFFIMPLITSLIMWKWVSYISRFPVSRSHALLPVAMLVLVAAIAWVMASGAVARDALLCLPIVGFAYIVYWTVRKSRGIERLKLFQYLGFLSVAILFWAIYMTLPSVMLLFIKDSVTTTVFGVRLSAQWFEIVDSLTLITMASILVRAYGLFRRRYDFSLSTSQVFVLGLTSLAAGSGLLAYSLLAPIVLAIGYIGLQSIAEAFIGPEGQSLSGKLTPKSLHGITAGAWLSTLGIANLLSSAITTRFLGGAEHITPHQLAHMHHFIFPTLVVVIAVLAAPSLVKLLKVALSSKQTTLSPASP